MTEEVKASSQLVSPPPQKKISFWFANLPPVLWCILYFPHTNQRSRGSEGSYCTSWVEMRSSCWVLCYFQLSPLPTLPSHFPKHCFFLTACLPRQLLDVLQYLCLRTRVCKTTKWTVTGQLSASVVKPLVLNFCVFGALFLRLSLPPTLSASTLTFLSLVSPAVCLFQSLSTRTYTKLQSSSSMSFVIFLIIPATYDCKTVFKTKHFHIGVSYCYQIVLWIKHLSSAFF